MRQHRSTAMTTEQPSLFAFIAVAIVGCAVFAITLPYTMNSGPGTSADAPLAIAICAMLSGTTTLVGAIGTCIVALQRVHVAITAQR